MKYEEAKAAAFARGTIPDGYFGNTARVSFTFDKETGRTLCVADHGYFGYHTPIAVDEAEAYWLLEHHPCSNASLLRRLPVGTAQ